MHVPAPSLVHPRKGRKLANRGHDLGDLMQRASSAPTALEQLFLLAGFEAKLQSKLDRTAHLLPRPSAVERAGASQYNHSHARIEALDTLIGQYDRLVMEQLTKLISRGFILTPTEVAGPEDQRRFRAYYREYIRPLVGQHRVTAINSVSLGAQPIRGLFIKLATGGKSFQLLITVRTDIPAFFTVQGLQSTCYMLLDMIAANIDLVIPGAEAEQATKFMAVPLPQLTPNAVRTALFVEPRCPLPVECELRRLTRSHEALTFQRLPIITAQDLLDLTHLLSL